MDPERPRTPTAPQQFVSGADPEATVSKEAPAEVLGGRFTLIRHFATGGLGTVWVARDGECRREVALKEMQADHAKHEQWRVRFLQEAEITGRLEHPGVVPVYGMGTYADGRPYYAMRLIRGTTLNDEIQRFHQDEETRSATDHALYFRKLLDHFMSACHTIDYAHSRGIIHRDVKPGNIMIGRYGETILIDWGLAKPLDQHESGASAAGPATLGPIKTEGGSARTHMGSTIGTPQYMSPEQADGRHDAVGPASDVYSLGATLYCLLTGRAPVERCSDAFEVMRRVAKGEWQSPREHDDRVPAGLNAVCLKAMARAPERRYASAALLARDVERWLADEPVSVLADPLAERLARMMRRHRSGTLVAAVSLVFATCVSTAALVKVRGALEHETAALHKAQTSLKDALVATDRLLDATRQVRDLEGGRSVSRSLLTSAEVVYQSLLESFRDNAEVQLKAARARAQLARALANSGDLEGAVTRYRTVVASTAELAKRAEADPKLFANAKDARECRVQMASAKRSLSDAIGDLHGTEHDDERIALLQEALTVYEKLREQDADDARARTGVAYTLSSLGSLQRGRQPDVARTSLRRAHEIFDAVITRSTGEAAKRAAHDAHDDDRRREQAMPWFGRGRVAFELGLLAEEAGKLDEAHALYHQARDDMRSAMTRMGAQQPFTLQRIADVLSRLGRLALRRGKLDEAREYMEEGLGYARTAMRLDRESWRIAQLVAEGSWTMSALHAATKDDRKAREALEQSIETLTSVIALAGGAHRPLPHIRRSLAAAASSLGLMLQEQKEMGVEEKLKLALEHADKIPDGETDPEAQAVRAICHGNLGIYYASIENHAEAATDLERAFELGRTPAVAKAWRRWCEIPGLRCPSWQRIAEYRCRAHIAQKQIVQAERSIDAYYKEFRGAPGGVLTTGCLLALAASAAPDSLRAELIGKAGKLFERALAERAVTAAEAAARPELQPFAKDPALAAIFNPR